ncbi:MAG TPA: outer membrane beta-barrel protein [Chitinophagales bacterium]|jgi:hypothetical protein|nr:outer membrane beta-barrel protein [Chitinophagales bacterium]HPA34933.1 outer membrane beta-barrel protein [Chitinophagales bacterium]HPW87127.1 outer membrane beta-barrel protein [Chitinophagales bacterium]HQO30599.1 outer membrane beta-barrel protein [Chitinophagales bacterium]HQO88576.1 outer membrane beta-barrel protein [Chitinophagales bacterium]
MKKWICYILLSLPLALAAKPQLFTSGSRIRFQLGAQAGVNTNYFKYRNIDQRDVSAGFQGGIFFRVSRQKVFAQLEMNYLWSQVFLKNGIFTSQVGNNIPFEKLTFRYHTYGIPFIFGGIPVKKALFKMRMYNGIEVDLIAQTRIILEQQNQQEYRLNRKEKRDIMRPAQFSYQLGTGFDIAMFVFDVKYNFGLRSFYKESYRTQTHLFQFTAGVIF